MPRATVTTKGQVTIPASVRRTLRIDAGDLVEFIEVGEGRFEVIAATRSLSEFEGMFAGKRRVVSIEEMNEAIASEGAEVG